MSTFASLLQELNVFPLHISLNSLHYFEVNLISPLIKRLINRSNPTIIPHSFPGLYPTLSNILHVSINLQNNQRFCCLHWHIFPVLLSGKSALKHSHHVTCHYENQHVCATDCVKINNPNKCGKLSHNT